MDQFVVNISRLEGLKSNKHTLTPIKPKTALPAPTLIPPPLNTNLMQISSLTNAHNHALASSRPHIENSTMQTAQTVLPTTRNAPSSTAPTSPKRVKTPPLAKKASTTPTPPAKPPEQAKPPPEVKPPEAAAPASNSKVNLGTQLQLTAQNFITRMKIKRSKSNLGNDNPS